MQYHASWSWVVVRSTLIRVTLAVTALLLAGSVAAQAQQAAKIPRVGVLRLGNPPPDDFGQREALEGGLRELGWTPGTNILIEYRYGQGQPERLAELVRLPVGVIVASAPSRMGERQAPAGVVAPAHRRWKQGTRSPSASTR